MKKFLVTGGAGFIGSHLVENLIQNGHAVTVIDNFHDFYNYKIKLKNLSEATGHPLQPFNNSKENDISSFAEESQRENFSLIYGDIRDGGLLDDVFEQGEFDMIIHLAALAGVRPSIENPLSYESVNVKGSMLLWEMCQKWKVKKFICASSSSVYGNNKKIPFAETDVVDFAISPYAATKKAGEVLGHVYHSLYGIDMFQLRFFTVYGPRQRPDLAIHKFTELISRGKPIPFYGDGNTARDYTYIDDIITGVMNSIDYLFENENVYEILNLGENEVITLKEMVSILEETLQKKAVLKRLPMQLGDVNLTNADISKARSLINYHPKTNFKNGISKFVTWYQQNK